MFVLSTYLTAPVRTRPLLEEDLVAGDVGRRAPDWDLIQCTDWDYNIEIARLRLHDWDYKIEIKRLRLQGGD